MTTDSPMAQPVEGRVHLAFEGRVATLTIDRPDAQNALNLAMWRSIPELVARVDAEPEIVALIVRGAGESAFAAGADISDLRASLDDPRAGREYMAAIGAAEQSIAACRRVTMARITGYCIGGGLELAMACDLRFAATSSTLATPPTSLGVAYSLSSTRRLIELVGVGKARDLLFTARRIDGHAAHQMGLVDHAVPPVELDELIEHYCGQLARQSQYAIRLTKLVIAEALNRPIETSPLEQLRVDSFSGADLREGIAAFESRRRPTFSSQWLE